MVVTYQCPNCGAPMVYGAKEGSMVCEHCGAEKTVAELEELKRQSEADQQERRNGQNQQTQPNQQNKQNQQNQQTQKMEQAGADQTQDFKSYRCPSCGAEVLTDEDTVATVCSFCGSPNLVEDRLRGEKRPVRLIPFKINREQAISKFKAWTRNGLLTPAGFTKSHTLEKITGIYVPFWLYDIRAGVDMNAICTRTRVSRRGDTEYIYTDHYDVRRSIDVGYDKIPADASKEMEDTLMDALEPFSYQDLTQFELAYLSGYMAERYQYTDEELMDRIRERVHRYADNACRETIGGYASINVVHEDIRLNKLGSEYVLLPVWMLSYTYKGKRCMFAINGQTGKTVGRPPISMGKVAAWYAGAAAVCFVLLNLIGGLPL